MTGSDVESKPLIFGPADNPSYHVLIASCVPAHESDSRRREQSGETHMTRRKSEITGHVNERRFAQSPNSTAIRRLPQD